MQVGERIPVDSCAVSADRVGKGKPEDRTYQSPNGPCDTRGCLGHPRLARTSMRTRRGAASGWIPLRLVSELRERFVSPLKPKVIA